MQRKPLGLTGLSISALAFGAGPISGLMTGDDQQKQRDAAARALELGINWFDTAAGYGQGRSEENLGRVLFDLGAAERCHVATKVRLMPVQLSDIRASVKRSVEQSLARLRLPRVPLLQLHNSITPKRGDEATSITPVDVLGGGGVLEAFQELRAAGKVDHFGLTGIGDPGSLRQVVRSRGFATIQLPFHVLNPSAGRGMPPGFKETDYGNLMRDCSECGVAVLAIRVFAGGSLLGAPPSAHTLKTKYFPFDLYQRDVQRATRLAQMLGGRMSLKELSLRYALSHSDITSVIVGVASAAELSEISAIAAAGPLSTELLNELEPKLRSVWLE
jgi:aryl-alcohol dehydrogenase-like predicted oxidoreductase